MLAWLHQSLLASDHTSAIEAEAGKDTAKEAGVVQLQKMVEMPNVVTEAVAERDNANASPRLKGAKFSISLPGKLPEAILRTGPQVNRTGTLSEAASTPGLTVGT